MSGAGDEQAPGGGRYRAETARWNPFVRSLGGARVLSALKLPFFLVRPPGAFGVLTTTGRKSGKARRKCVRVIRSGNEAYLVSIGGADAAWVKNVRANPAVRLRLRGGSMAGTVRELRDSAERDRARKAYCETISPFDYLMCAMHRNGRPTRTKIVELVRSWFATGTPLVVELRAPAPRRPVARIAR
ncbi:MAG: nitroreductase family deazaflavin-dependent oxidoreductase [Pseudonocardiaceae bacterium]|nr:nitroreductase family deazaflavin-dependent oxidoreductase [Pseudonocardiaceae bacterium]